VASSTAWRVGRERTTPSCTREVGCGGNGNPEVLGAREGVHHSQYRMVGSASRCATPNRTRSAEGGRRRTKVVGPTL